MLLVRSHLVKRDAELLDLFSSSAVGRQLDASGETFVIESLTRRPFEPLIDVSVSDAEERRHEIVLEEVSDGDDVRLEFSVVGTDGRFDEIACALRRIRGALKELRFHEQFAPQQGVRDLAARLDPSLTELSGLVEGARAQLPPRPNWSDRMLTQRLINGRWVPLPCGGGVEFDEQGPKRVTDWAFGASPATQQEIIDEVEELLGWRIRLEQWERDRYDPDGLPPREADVFSYERVRADN